MEKSFHLFNSAERPSSDPNSVDPLKQKLLEVSYPNEFNIQNNVLKIGERSAKSAVSNAHQELLRSFRSLKLEKCSSIVCDMCLDAPRINNDFCNFYSDVLVFELFDLKFL